MPTQKSQGGFSLIETIIVVVLLGIMMAGMTVLFVENASKSHQPYLRQRALAVANAYMDEILHKRWDDNSPLGGGCVVFAGSSCASGPGAAGIGTEEGARSNYDDIDDYNGLNDSPPLDSLGNTMTGYSGFSVAVSVSSPGSAWNGIAAVDVKLIKVDVTSTMQETISISAYRVNF